MPEIGPEYPITYRQEFVASLFQRIQARESVVIVGAASMGKSRLLQFICARMWREYYLRKEVEACFVCLG